MPERRVVYSHSHLFKFASCPRSYQLHYVERLPAETSDASRFGRLLHRTARCAIREHVAQRRCGPVAPQDVVHAYRQAWRASDLTDAARFEEGLRPAKKGGWSARGGSTGGTSSASSSPSSSRSATTASSARSTASTAPEQVRTRVRDYKTVRVPMSRAEVEESLQLAIYDLAARQLWPNASRVELEIELLRHGTVIRTTRTDEQRAATREYVLATIARNRGRRERRRGVPHAPDPPVPDVRPPRAVRRVRRRARREADVRVHGPRGPGGRLARARGGGAAGQDAGRAQGRAGGDPQGAPARRRGAARRRHALRARYDDAHGVPGRRDAGGAGARDELRPVARCWSGSRRSGRPPCASSSTRSARRSRPVQQPSCGRCSRRSR